MLKEVIKEATLLIKETTTEEKNRLNFNSLHALDVNNCIYGQMTGYCYSERATELLEKCAIPFSEVVEYDESERHIIPKELRPNLSFRHVHDYDVRKYYSPIEVFISFDRPKAKKRLLDYIKGDRKTLRKRDLV